MNYMYENSYIHQQIMAVYEALREERRKKVDEINRENYIKQPELEKIDTSISLLAINYARRVAVDELTPEEAVSLMEKDRDELVRKKAVIIEKHGLENPDLVEYSCSVCHDTGFLDKEETRPCQCYEKTAQNYIVKRNAEESMLGLKAANDTFENFSFKYYSKDKGDSGISPFENMQSIYKECVEFTENFANTDTKNLLFYGAPGLGKTYLSRAIANRLMLKGVSVVYQTAYQLFQFLEEYKFGKISREENEKLYKKIYNSDLLIIDDLGTEFITSYTCSVFFDVLNSRLLNNKKIIISTNLSIGEIENIYSGRVMSRILGEYNVLYFFGDDIRRMGDL